MSATTTTLQPLQPLQSLQSPHDLSPTRASATPGTSRQTASSSTSSLHTNNTCTSLAYQGFSNTECITLDCIFVHTIPLLASAGQCRPVLEVTCNGREVRLFDKYTNIRHLRMCSLNIECAL